MSISHLQDSPPNPDAFPHPNPSPSSTSAPPLAPENNAQTPTRQPQTDPAQPRFSPEEEASLLSESNTLKASANATFSRGDFSSAITHYDRALASCPTYLDYETAVLKSNIAACHLKLEDWKAAIEAATAALDGLERLLPSPKPKAKKQEPDEAGGPASEEKTSPDSKENEGNGVIELEGDDDAVSAALEKLDLDDKRKSDIQRIRSKSLLRRARARSQFTTWSDLQAAEDDYRILASRPDLPPSDRRVVEQALRLLPERVKMARDAEVGEMMGKLKELGNGLLKPFGLSTDMFKVQQGENGGYSLSVNQGGE